MAGQSRSAAVASTAHGAFVHATLRGAGCQRPGDRLYAGTWRTCTAAAAPTGGLSVPYDLSGAVLGRDISLVLAGGIALGAYEAGAFAGLLGQAGLRPGWPARRSAR